MCIIFLHLSWIFKHCVYLRLIAPIYYCYNLFSSFSCLGSAAEDSGSRSSSRRSSVAYTTDLLVEEQLEMTRELEETKKVIAQLQELVSEL